MTLEAYIKRLEALGLGPAAIFNHAISAMLETKKTMLEYVKEGSVDVSNAIMNGFEVSYDNIISNLEEV